ncbi:MAG: SusD/RagB family nutrient-binding outer membrane lipoprotein [Bacteroidia bacterium]|nr:MAG: SusD/RagB family nutrient-binding outer membrane lipoprotein [Bacteroidia bacterium]
MKRIITLLSVTVLLGLLVGSCDFFDLDLTEDPDAVVLSDANPDYALNAMQVNFKNFVNDDDPANWNGMNKIGMEVVRMMNPWGGTYENSYNPTNFDQSWDYAYEGLLMDAHTFLPIYEEKEWWIHAGITKVLQAYTLVTLVDFFGDIPWTESFDATNFNPAADDDQLVYDVAISKLDEAIADLDKDAMAVPSSDLFYGGDTDAWITLAKTLKLKIYLNLRLVDATRATSGINGLIQDGDLINEASQNWVFEYSRNTDNPDSRHPYFTYNYLNGGNDYMANYFMWTLYEEKSVVDPRIRYYFYRQVLESSENFQELPCFGTPRPPHYPVDMPFCTLSDGYWGRDHLDDDGIPPDTRKRALWGVYPAGGEFDSDIGLPGAAASGMQGAGAEVLMLDSYVKFMEAEAALTLGTTGDPKLLLLEAVQSSIDYVMAFGEETAVQEFIPTQEDIDDYLTELETLYDNASSDTERLEVIVKEYYIALFGNGIESYNLVKRTAMPSNLQPALLADPGNFPRTFNYPADCVNLNSAIDQKPHSVQVFWDTNPAGSIK